MTAVGRVGHPTAQSYCVSRPTAGNYGQLATFATWADYSAVTSMFVNYPNTTNGRSVHIGLQYANATSPMWEDPHGVCTVRQFPIGSGPVSCGSWIYNPAGSLYVIAFHSWCDWEAGPVADGGPASRWLICEFGKQDLLFSQ